MDDVEHFYPMDSGDDSQAIARLDQLDIELRFRRIEADRIGQLRMLHLVEPSVVSEAALQSAVRDYHATREAELGRQLIELATATPRPLLMGERARIMHRRIGRHASHAAFAADRLKVLGQS